MAERVKWVQRGWSPQERMRLLWETSLYSWIVGANVEQVEVGDRGIVNEAGPGKFDSTGKLCGSRSSKERKS